MAGFTRPTPRQKAPTESVRRVRESGACLLVGCTPHSVTHTRVLVLVRVLARRFAAALLPRLFGTNRRPHHKGATGRVRRPTASRPTASSFMPLPTWLMRQQSRIGPYRGRGTSRPLDGGMAWPGSFAQRTIAGSSCRGRWDLYVPDPPAARRKRPPETESTAASERSVRPARAMATTESVRRVRESGACLLVGCWNIGTTQFAIK